MKSESKKAVLFCVIAFALGCVLAFSGCSLSGHGKATLGNQSYLEK
jgi:hypothetical protein